MKTYYFWSVIILVAMAGALLNESKKPLKGRPHPISCERKAG